VGTPAVTHAGYTSLFVPDEAWRMAHGGDDAFVVEAVGSSGPDRPQDGTYDFPMVSLLLPLMDRNAARMFHRVVVTSVHLSPYAKNAAARDMQASRVADAAARMAKGLPTWKTAGKTKIPIAGTTFIVAGDTNMREEEVMLQRQGYTDAYTAYDQAHPEEAWAAKWTWDTSIGYNGNPGPVGHYKARYDRVSWQVAQPAAAVKPRLVAMRVIGSLGLVNPAWDDAVDAYREAYPPLSQAPADEEQAAASRLLSDIDAAEAQTTFADDAPHAASADSYGPTHRFLSDHFGLVTTFEWGTAEQ
jgi:hypothetical protein